jgi:hypothetical protein
MGSLRPENVVVLVKVHPIQWSRGRVNARCVKSIVFFPFANVLNKWRISNHQLEITVSSGNSPIHLQHCVSIATIAV